MQLDRDQEAEYLEYLKGHPRCHLLQTPQWGRIKRDWINEYAIVRDADGQIKGGMSILIRRLPGSPFHLMYAPRGPVCDLHDAQVIAALTIEARRIARKYHAFSLKIDTDAPADDTEYADIMKRLGYRLNSNYTNLEGVQARYVFRINLAGKTAEQVMASFHPKTRYNIRVAQRNGVTIRIGSREDIPVFYDLLQETAKRDGFVNRGIEYYYRMHDCLGENHRLILAYHEDKPLAGAVIGYYGNKCFYLYGASSGEGRKNMPAYLVQWSAIEWSIEKGCAIYDLRGVPGVIEDENNPIYGLYRFKKGFGGDLVEFVGEFDLVFQPLLFRVFTWLERMRKSTRKALSHARSGKHRGQ